jgi:hypothetical protein
VTKGVLAEGVVVADLGELALGVDISILVELWSDWLLVCNWMIIVTGMKVFIVEVLLLLIWASS